MQVLGGDANGIEKQTAVFEDPRHVIDRANEYIRYCSTQSEGAKKRGRFANLAGFCRFLGVGVDTFEREMAEHPEAYGAICAMLEDEALNSDLSATLVSAYLKTRLGYGGKSEPRHTAEDGQIQLIFEHDIYEDGG